MRPSSRLKLAALLFGAGWTLAMFWWSGHDSIANAAILAVCGAAAGAGWYWLMRWHIARGRVPMQR